MTDKDEPRYRLAELFGYVLLDSAGNVVERCPDPPSKWRPEIRAMIEKKENP